MARRRLIRFALLGIAAYAVAMIATIPAGAVFKNYAWRSGISGTIWNGEVGIVGGSVARWQFAPLRSLLSLGYAADWRLRGPDTDLGGRVVSGLGGTVLDKVSGSATASLLQAIQPNLPFACDIVGQVEIDRLVVGGSERMMAARMVSDPGSCRPRFGGGPTQLPSLILTAQKTGKVTTIRLAPATQRLKTLLSGTLAEDGTLTISLTPEGAEMMPFIGLPAGRPFTGRM
ncbi:type II secretion system protein N [Sphingomonas sp. LB-2]|uniref:type II secretion system protein N n=1 Tax=Sphingomonas caeni TaxID=2984949 RepID=UPI00222FA7FD|nr:type II secretion system protein N [Sphingomonas caeni]MCW3847455.1 type II secretion system protein N [Sphingomonas caeni]